MEHNSLTEDDIGRRVIYQDLYRIERGLEADEREGYITSFNKSFIFVCFDGTGRGQACHCRNIRFAPPNPPIKWIFKRPKHEKT